jgi:hypothetical protein
MFESWHKQVKVHYRFRYPHQILKSLRLQMFWYSDQGPFLEKIKATFDTLSCLWANQCGNPEKNSRECPPQDWK